jgi:hypothetical protein
VQSCGFAERFADCLTVEKPVASTRSEYSIIVPWDFGLLSDFYMVAGSKYSGTTESTSCSIMATPQHMILDAQPIQRSWMRNNRCSWIGVVHSAEEFGFHCTPVTSRGPPRTFQKLRVHTLPRLPYHPSDCVRAGK